jgi:glycerol-3-phosphate dehydrogenase (NAD(P)+)
MELKVAVLGGGSWGTTVASLVTRNADTLLWARNSDTVDEINKTHSNERYLPGAKLPKRLAATADVAEAVGGADVIVMGIPSQNFRSVLQDIRPHIRAWVPVISLTKGLELSTRSRMTEIIAEELPGHPIGVLTGPNLAREIMAGQAAAGVIAMEDPVVVRALQNLFHSGLYRTYTNHDLIGCELGGVLKNIIAIAAGMGDGLGAGENTRSAIITRGLSEISRLGVALGGELQTFAGLAGLGDLIATSTSPQSRNRTYGFELGKGRSVEEIAKDMFMVAEGVKSAPAVVELAHAHNVSMPIAEEVHGVVTGEIPPERAFRGLLRIAPTSEAEPG